MTDDDDHDDEEECDRACDECGEPADGPGDVDRVNCDCGTVVCSACCDAYDGESYCRDCADEKRKSRAWRVATAIALKSGLDWGRWASGESRPLTMACDCGVTWHGNTHTRWRCYCSRDHVDHVRTTPVHAPWDADAYRADCARRDVEPGPTPSLWSDGIPGIFFWVAADGARANINVGAVASVIRDGRIIVMTHDDGCEIDDLATLTRLATAASKAMKP